MKIKYIHHSGFLILDGDCSLMIDCCDPAGKNREFLAYNSGSLYMLASHSHGDHFDPGIMSFGFGQRKWILSADIYGKVPVNRDVYFLEKGNVYSDPLVTVRAYGSTDTGISFYMETGGKKIFHAGDLNNWHWNEEETPKNAAKNEKWFLDELALIAHDVPVLDAAMFPVDPRLGKDYMRGAEQFLDSIKTGLFIPMHFWDNIKAAGAFKQAAEKRGCSFANITAQGDVFEI